jgi:hypothetical protein
MTSPDHVACRISESLGDGRGTSLVRLGDGEGVLLARGDIDDPVLGPYLTTHFGNRLTQERLDDLSDHVLQAVKRADVIGIRPDVNAREYPTDLSNFEPPALIDWAREHLSLRKEESETLDYDSAYRLALLGRWMASFHWPTDALLTSAWCHFEWLESGFLADLAMRERRIGLVTGRRRLSPLFRSAGIEVDEWLVPLRFLRRDERWTPHFPDRFDELLDTLEPAYAGQLFFVGAGICGKVYCDVIARRGGVAIDIGAVCDAWLGIASRPRVAHTRWGQESVPEHLLLEHQLAIRTATTPRAGND